MTRTRLNDHKHANCYIEQDGNKTIFVSYSTPVIFITYENGERHIECTGTYSQTTRKQIGYFLKEYLPEFTYHDMKKIAGQGAVKM